MTAPSKRLTLIEARANGRLADFVRQQEVWELENGYAGADRKELEAGLAATIKAPQPEGRTSRSRGRGSSTGT
jgi:hypothetical protein